MTDLDVKTSKPNLQHQIDLLVKSLEQSQNHEAALASTITVMAMRIDALEERIGVVRELVNAALNAPIPGHQFPLPPQPVLPNHYPPLPPPIFPRSNGDLAQQNFLLQQGNLDMTRKMQAIVKILIGDVPLYKEEGEYAPRSRD
jgi:hypothetical protein